MQFVTADDEDYKKIARQVPDVPYLKPDGRPPKRPATDLPDDLNQGKTLPPQPPGPPGHPGRPGGGATVTPQTPAPRHPHPSATDAAMLPIPQSEPGSDFDSVRSRSPRGGSAPGRPEVAQARRSLLEDRLQERAMQGAKGHNDPKAREDTVVPPRSSYS